MTKENKERRCLKFTGYIYLPDDEDLKSNNNARNYMSNLGMGRLIIVDEFGLKIDNKEIAFSNVGQMLKIILDIASKRIKARLLTIKQRKKGDEDGTN